MPFLGMLDPTIHNRSAGGRFDSHMAAVRNLGLPLRCWHRTPPRFAKSSSHRRNGSHVVNAQQNGASRQQGPKEPLQPQVQDEGAQDACQPVAEDPLEAMLYVAQQEMGMNVVWADPEEDWDDALEDLEDIWMRNPAPPEWAEVTGMLPNSGSSSSVDSSVQGTNRSIPVVKWQELQEEQQRQLVILHITTDDTATARQLPDPSPQADGKGPSQPAQTMSLRLAELTRDAAAAWQDRTVAVLDTGHHTCLGAAIRLSAVYRLPNVVLLQLEDDL